MKVNLTHCIIISVIFSIIGYVIFNSTEANANLPLTVAGALLISGIVTPWVSSLLVTTGGSSESSSNKSNPTSANISTLYVGNLPYKANEDAVKSYFEDHIEVQSVRLMKDRKTGKRKGYGFVEVINGDMDSIISQFNDSVFQDRTLKVRPAKDKAGIE